MSSHCDHLKTEQDAGLLSMKQPTLASRMVEHRIGLNKLTLNMRGKEIFYPIWIKVCRVV